MSYATWMMCVWGRSVEEHDTSVATVLKRTLESGMMLNESTCEFPRDTIRFLGHVLSASGTKANPEAVQGIRDFSAPQNVSDVRSFLCMANQLGKFSAKLGEPSTPLQSLLRKGTERYWDVA